MRFFLVFLLALNAYPLLAQEKSDGWSAGAFGTAGQSIYVGKEASFNILPSLSYKTGSLEFGLNGISVTAIEAGPSKVEAFLRPRFFELVFAEAPELAGIDRDITGDLGASWLLEFSPETSVTLTVAQEVTGKHDGQEIELQADHQIAIGQIPVFLTGKLAWQSEGLAEYLYGVRAREATGTRPAYAPGSVVIPSISVSTGYPLTPQALLFGGVAYSALPDAVSRSPIVNRRDEITLFAGINYAF